MLDLFPCPKYLPGLWILEVLFQLASLPSHLDFSSFPPWPNQPLLIRRTSTMSSPPNSPLPFFGVAWFSLCSSTMTSRIASSLCLIGNNLCLFQLLTCSNLKEGTKSANSKPPVMVTPFFNCHIKVSLSLTTLRKAALHVIELINAHSMSS